MGGAISQQHSGQGIHQGRDISKEIFSSHKVLGTRSTRASTAEILKRRSEFSPSPRLQPKDDRSSDAYESSVQLSITCIVKTTKDNVVSSDTKTFKVPRPFTLNGFFKIIAQNAQCDERAILRIHLDSADGPKVLAPPFPSEHEYFVHINLTQSMLSVDSDDVDEDEDDMWVERTITFTPKFKVG